MKFANLDQRAWRVGFLPQPWEWPDWRWAGPDGRFDGRWDPLDHGLYRTVFAAESLLACLVELLAPHRPDPYLAAEIDAIEEDESDAEQFPSGRPGELDVNQWLVNRIAGSARLAGRFVDITSAETVAGLHPLFRGKALAYNLKDFDGAALKNAENRLLTQEVSQYPWTRKNPDGSDYCDGIQFRSRHGDDLLLWAIFERDTDGQAIAYAVRSASCRGFLNACFYPGAGAGDAYERRTFVSFAANENGPAPLKAGVVYILPSRSFTRMPSYTDPILGLITECQFVSTEPVLSWQKSQCNPRTCRSRRYSTISKLFPGAHL